MVKTVSSAQYSVFRKEVAARQACSFLMSALKHFLFPFAFLNTELCILSAVMAKDLGTHGVIYSIEEQDPIQLIQQKLKMMEESGELKRRNLELQSRTRASIERPKPVEGMSKATKTRVFYFDPTYEVKEDLYDHQGHKFAQKGERINPLESMSLSQSLIFFNGDDEVQVGWVKEQIAQKTERRQLKLILIKGMPLKLTEELGIPVYFDQGGILTQKLGINCVPVVVSQDKLQLKIEEIVLPPSRELNSEGVR